MRRALASIAIACATAGAASAQPPPPPPGPVYTAPGYHLLSDEERDLLAQGEISDGAHFGGGLVGTFFGFGLGHLVQGRFGDKGWIIMAGEAASVTILAFAMADCYSILAEDPGERCRNDGRFVIGLVGLLGFHIWELIDVWGGPPAHNERVRAIRLKAGLPPHGLFVSPSLGRGDGGGVAGLTLRF